MNSVAASPSPPHPTPAVDPLLQPRRLLLSTILSFVALLGIVGAVGYWLRAPLVAVSEGFIATLGGPGIALGYFLPDAFSLPFPNDTFGVFGLAGGMGFWEVVAWGTFGSILGGCMGWWIGRVLRRTRWVAAFMDGRGHRLELLVRRQGPIVVFVAAVTPLPYSIAAWAAGGVGMPLHTFVLVSLSRVFRVAGALYLIQLGLLTTG